MPMMIDAGFYGKTARQGKTEWSIFVYSGRQ
jgi:hypothetical protein